MGVNDLMYAVTAIIRVFENPLYVAFTLMIAFAALMATKRLIIE